MSKSYYNSTGLGSHVDPTINRKDRNQSRKRKLENNTEALDNTIVPGITCELYELATQEQTINNTCIGSKKCKIDSLCNAHDNIVNMQSGKQTSCDIITNFKKAVSCGPEYVFCCCMQTWPQDLELTSLEERLVAPRIPFMQIYEKARGGQYAVKGNDVNVPVDVNKTIRVLPRMLNDCETIPVKLKRKQSYKHHVSYQNIRPNKVLNAAKYLGSNRTLFKNEGITVDESWLESYQMALKNNQDDNIDNENTSTEFESENSREDQD
ncbi:unnamed protein product [Mytilus coruscus]|uniref:DUF6570 domain-containing protein n=1 Tax=Mytilus coruscus TaxID=42192 RepID=A0A6J8AF09_MYTCO|nr:unnamed protein product [Mytilus coruscus]